MGWLDGTDDAAKVAAAKAWVLKMDAQRAQEQAAQAAREAAEAQRRAQS